MAERGIRVMQSFGAPRPTTNPYIVMLRDALVASDEVEHLPFSWRGALTGAYDVFHVHWPDTLLDGRSAVTRTGKRLAFGVLLLRLRLRRTPVVRTVHNLSEPSGPRIDRLLVSSLNRLTRFHIRISATTPETPGVPSVLIPHGHYRDWYDGMPRADRIPGRLGYVGLIKPYKGIDALLAAFADARAAHPELTLDVSGRPADDASAAAMEDAQRRIPGVAMTLRYVDEEEFVAAVTRASLVVLPYRLMHNSGSLLAALSLDRPVLVPDNETNRAIADEVGAEWVHRFDGDLTAEAIVRAAAAPPPATPRPDLSAREWTDAAAHHAIAYRRAMTELSEARAPRRQSSRRSRG